MQISVESTEITLRSFLVTQVSSTYPSIPKHRLSIVINALYSPSAMKHTRVNELFYKRLGWGRNRSPGDVSEDCLLGEAEALSIIDEIILRVSLSYQCVLIILLGLIALLLTAILIHQSEWQTCTRKHSVYCMIIHCFMKASFAHGSCTNRYLV